MAQFYPPHTPVVSIAREFGGFASFSGFPEPGLEASVEEERSCPVCLHDGVPVPQTPVGGLGGELCAHHHASSLHKYMCTGCAFLCHFPASIALLLLRT